MYEFAGGSLTDKDLQEPKFWNDFVSAPESSAVLSVRFPSSFYYSSNYGNGFALLFTQIFSRGGAKQGESLFDKTGIAVIETEE